jgi:hypothetical protein
VALLCTAVGVAVARNRTSDEPLVDRRPGAAAPAAAYDPQPQRRFIRVGTNTGAQFTDDDLRTLAAKFDVVLFTKFHAGGEVRQQHEAASLLMELRPDLEVYPYFSTKYWFFNDKWDGPAVEDRWLLRDVRGDVVYRDRKRDAGGNRVAYVDLANAEYRAWALESLERWLRAAPYAGLSFDAAEPIGDHGEKEIRRWQGLLGSDRVAAYNDGLRTLLREANDLAGRAGRQVVFNGIAPSDPRGANRNLDLLDITDGALDERFCVDINNELHALDQDLELLDRYEKPKRLFLRTNFLTRFDAEDRAQRQRLCVGAFLLGWKPGSSYFQFGGDYTSEQLDESDSDLQVNLGVPLSQRTRDGDVAQRQFQHGVLVVNLGPEAKIVTIEKPGVDVQSGRIMARYKAGDRVTVPSEDALFLLDPELLE